MSQPSEDDILQLCNFTGVDIATATAFLKVCFGVSSRETFVSLCTCLILFIGQQQQLGSCGECLL